MISEDTDIAEWCVRNARDRTAVVDQLSHVVPTVAHSAKPRAGDAAERWRPLIEPAVDGRLAFERAFEPEDAVHAVSTLAAHRAISPCGAAPLSCGPLAGRLHSYMY